MYYRIRHLTRFQYSEPVSESLMEVRMHPRTEGQQRCLDYQLGVTPRSNIHTYRDFLGNNIHHFSVPGAHKQLQIVAESIVEMTDWPEAPTALGAEAWDELDRAAASGDFYEMLLPSHFARTTPLLKELMQELDARRQGDPLGLVLGLNRSLYRTFEYVPAATRVDSPIDHAISMRKGVCQDFAHIMIAMLRELRIPARYVSGYLHHGKEDHDRSSEGATHAWLEAFLPEVGWLGVDPTNDLLAQERHIRTAIGRDYADVPPTRGVLKGQAETMLTVAVAVNPCDELPQELVEMVISEDHTYIQAAVDLDMAQQLEQEQQQQQ